MGLPETFAARPDGLRFEAMGLTLTGTGVWSPGLRFYADRGAAASAAAELEALGYTALWMPGGDARTAFDAAGDLLRATSTVTVATGILSIWHADPEWVAAERAELHDAHPAPSLPPPPARPPPPPPPPP